MGKISTYLFLAVALGGCAQSNPVFWDKPNATTADFDADKYKCLQSSQQKQAVYSSFSSGGISPNAISSSSMRSGSVTNDELFEACMNASGWHLRGAKKVKGENWVVYSSQGNITKLYDVNSVRRNGDAVSVQIATRNSADEIDDQIAKRRLNCATRAFEELDSGKTYKVSVADKQNPASSLFNLLCNKSN